MPKMTPQDIADCLETITAHHVTNAMQETVAMQAATYMHKIATGKLKPVVHCKDCIYGNDCKRYVNIVADADSVRPVTFCSAGKRKP